MVGVAGMGSDVDDAGSRLSVNICPAGRLAATAEHARGFMHLAHHRELPFRLAKSWMTESCVDKIMTAVITVGK
jgi:hypothetical protein